ncbi:hypothetical protein NUM_48550 [Actinocatenispora comari]|uniref:Uncharacterized protein n=1 Tax=Actinocatenispora comari TaxID=2807577 RepID=A0A8J4EMI9_9ACTN|nr:hypothetical protein NUM_48550 [Actinocatenispora comari]
MAKGAAPLAGKEREEGAKPSPRIPPQGVKRRTEVAFTPPARAHQRAEVAAARSGRTRGWRGDQAAP